MKKLINDVSEVVPQMLAGLAALDPGLVLLPGGVVAVRADATTAGLDQVALVSGGGSGHEPAHAGYVGPGMLSAAVAGEIFTSPSTDVVLEAIRAVAGPRGVLLIVKSYTGDRLNFGLAAEIARSEGTEVELVVVADDVALSDDDSNAGRRGLAGTILVHKVAGAAAAEGLSLTEVADVARSTVASLGTMGVAFSPSTVPAAGRPGFTLADDEIEWGLGIHGETGVQRGRHEPADVIVERLLSTVIDDLGLRSGSRVALLVNNLGGSAAGEITLVAGVAVRYLRGRGLEVERAWAGTFLTALEMAGCSLSLLEVDDQRVARLDAPTRTWAWPDRLGRLAPAEGTTTAAPAPALTQAADSGEAQGRLDPASGVARAITAACEALVAAEPELTALDSQVGDGDLGDSLARAARGILAELAGYPSAQSPGAVLRAMSATVRRVVGGTSGPLYAVLLIRAAVVLEEPDGPDWAAAFSAAVAGVQELGGAQLGDRTMVDALAPAADAFTDELRRSSDLETALARMVDASAAGARHTATLTARRGRSSYVGERAIGVPDPGAEAVTRWLAAIRDALSDGRD